MLCVFVANSTALLGKIVDKWSCILSTAPGTGTAAGRLVEHAHTVILPSASVNTET